MILIEAGFLTSDATLPDHGVAQNFWNYSDVAAVGRVPEVRRWTCGTVLARRHAFESADFPVDSCSGKVLRDCFGRLISLDPEMAEIIASERWETDSSFPEVPSRLLSSHSWKKGMADKWFFDDDILRFEAWALVEAAHSQPVHDCRTNLPIVLCFSRGRSLDVSLLTQITRIASVCLGSNITISIRWIPSELNSSERGSREHDNPYGPTKCLVDHLGSNDGQSILVSHACLCREPGSCEYEALTTSDEVAVNRDLFPETLSAVAEEKEDSLCTELAGDETQGSEKAQPPHDKGPRESSSSAKRLRRIRPGGT